MMYLRSLVYDAIQTVLTVAMLLGMVVLLPFPWRAIQASVWMWAQVLRFLLRVLVGQRIRFEGLENVPRGAAVIASKHQSAFDTAVFLLVFPYAVYVMKKELLSLPLWGWYARKCRSIGVDRKGGAKALRKMLDDTRAELATGRKVIIFPEGTRVRPGEHRRHHPGVAAIYQAVDAPVIPVALNSGLFWGRRSVGRKYAGTITVRFLPAMPAGLDRRAFAGELQARIDGETDRLEAEARAAHPWLPAPDPAAATGGTAGADDPAAAPRETPRESTGKAG